MESYEEYDEDSRAFTVRHVGTTSEEELRQRIATLIGYEMIGNGKRTGADISYGVVTGLRDFARENPRTLKIILEAIGLDVIEGWLDAGEDHEGVAWRAAKDRETLEGTWVAPVQCLVMRPRGDETKFIVGTGDVALPPLNDEEKGESDA